MRKTLGLFLSFCLMTQQVGFAQVALDAGLSASMLLRNHVVADPSRPLHLRYFSYNTSGDTFNLLLDKGGLKSPPEAELETSTAQLLKYFLIGVTLPNECFWVNLRPDGQNNILDPWLEKTDIGKILLEADLELKKDTSRFTSPQTPEGKIYWNKLYQYADELFGQSTDVNIPALTRPWIVPGEIIIRETEDSAYIYKATLKVLLEQDHLKNSSEYNFADPRLKALNEYSSQLLRELVIPQLTKEVNVSKRYASLRQVYYSLVLARWFKQRFAGKPGIYSGLINKQDLTNLTSSASWSKDTYFKAYQKSFKDGEYNLQESVYTMYGETIRQYISGGIQLGVSSPASREGGFFGSSQATRNLFMGPGFIEREGSAATLITFSPLSDKTPQKFLYDATRQMLNPVSAGLPAKDIFARMMMGFRFTPEIREAVLPQLNEIIRLSKIIDQDSRYPVETRDEYVREFKRLVSIHNPQVLRVLQELRSHLESIQGDNQAIEALKLGYPLRFVLQVLDILIGDQRGTVTTPAAETPRITSSPAAMGPWARLIEPEEDFRRGFPSQTINSAKLQAAVKAIYILVPSVRRNTLFGILSSIKEQPKLNDPTAVFEVLRGIAISKINENKEGSLTNYNLLDTFRRWIQEADADNMIKLSEQTSEEALLGLVSVNTVGLASWVETGQNLYQLGLSSAQLDTVVKTLRSFLGASINPDVFLRILSGAQVSTEGSYSSGSKIINVMQQEGPYRSFGAALGMLYENRSNSQQRPNGGFPSYRGSSPAKEIPFGTPTITFAEIESGMRLFRDISQTGGTLSGTLSQWRLLLEKLLYGMDDNGRRHESPTPIDEQAVSILNFIAIFNGSYNDKVRNLEIIRALLNEMYRRGIDSIKVGDFVIEGTEQDIALQYQGADKNIKERYATFGELQANSLAFYYFALDGNKPVSITFKESAVSIPAAASPASQNKVPLGGIDFRAMNILIQPMGSFADLQFTLPVLADAARINVDEQLRQMQALIAQKEVPSGHQVKELLAAAFAQKELDTRADEILACLVNICRLQEELVEETSPELREALVIFEFILP